MAVRYVNAAEFDEVTKEGIWIADFYTDHCAPCKMLDMVLDQVVFDNPLINLAKCDLEESSEFIERFDIGGTPTLLFMNNGQIVERSFGAIGRAKLEEHIAKCMYGN